MNEDRRPTVLARPTKPKQPLSAKLSLVFLGLAAVIGVVRIFVSPAGNEGALIGVLLGLAVIGLFLGWYSLNTGARARLLRRLAPDAVIVPFSVTDELVHVTMRLARRLDSPGVQVGTEKVASLAVSPAGIHIMSTPHGQVGFIPRELVSLAGFGFTTLGTRDFPSIVLRVTVDGEQFDLNVAPSDGASGIRTLSVDELEDLAGQIRSKLATQVP